MKGFTYYVPQYLIFGPGSFKRLATLPMPGKKALIVTTDERLFVEETIALLKENGETQSVVYDGIRPNPNSTSINEAARFGAANNCDFVVSIGGGSPMDAAQCIAMLMYDGPENDIWDYVQYYEGHRVPSGCLPMILISTTAGTGSEVVPGGVLSNDELDIKLDVGDPCMFATYSIVDPELQLSVPRDLTACQGMDVIFHCVEGYLDKYHSPYSDMVYLEGLKYAAASIKTAYKFPDNLEARTHMALASNLAGIGESLSDVMSLHAMAHTIGSFHHDIPHGVALSMFAPEVLEFYATYPIETTQRMAYMADVVGYESTPEGCVRFIKDILKALDLYAIDYRKYGIDPARCCEYAHHTVVKIAPYMDKDEHSPTEEEMYSLYKRALERQTELLKKDN